MAVREADVGVVEDLGVECVQSFATFQDGPKPMPLPLVHLFNVGIQLGAPLVVTSLSFDESQFARLIDAAFGEVDASDGDDEGHRGNDDGG